MTSSFDILHNFTVLGPSRLENNETNFVVNISYGEVFDMGNWVKVIPTIEGEPLSEDSINGLEITGDAEVYFIYLKITHEDRDTYGLEPFRNNIEPREEDQEKLYPKIISAEVVSSIEKKYWDNTITWIKLANVFRITKESENPSEGNFKKILINQFLQSNILTRIQGTGRRIANLAKKLNDLDKKTLVGYQVFFNEDNDVILHKYYHYWNWKSEPSITQYNTLSLPRGQKYSYPFLEWEYEPNNQLVPPNITL